MNKLMFPALVLLFSCSAATLAPNSTRTIKYQERTQASKDEAYNSSLAYIAKNFGDSNHAIKMKDKDAGMIISKGNIICNALRQSGDVNDYSLRFNMSIRAKNNSYSLVFDGLEMLDERGIPVRWEYNQITDETKVSKIKVCLDPIKKGLFDELN